MDESKTTLSVAEQQDHQSGVVARQIEEISAADGAVVMRDLSRSQAADVAEYLDPDTASRILAQMDPTLAASVITDMEQPEAAMVLQSMEPDDRVDVLEHVPAALHDELLLHMDAGDAAATRRLELHANDTAGGIMTSEVTALYEHLTVENAISTLRKLNEELEQMFYVYVIDSREHLVGVLSMRDLILAQPNSRLRQIMIPNVRSVPATMDQEEVARLFRKHHYLAMPVVDERGRLIGLITHDDVMDVMQEEATEDVQKMFGAGAEERLSSPVAIQFSKARRLAGSESRDRISRGMGDQLVRRRDCRIAGAGGLSIDRFRNGRKRGRRSQGAGRGDSWNGAGRKRREADLASALPRSDRRFVRGRGRRSFHVGRCAALGVFGRSQYHGQPILVGFVICIALILNHINACTTGAMIPFVMRRLGFDPRSIRDHLCDHVHRLRRFFPNAVAGQSDRASEMTRTHDQNYCAGSSDRAGGESVLWAEKYRRT